MTCFCCGEKGHYSDNFPEKDNIAKKDWAIKQELTMLIEKQNEEGTKNEEENNNTNTCWMGVQFNNTREEVNMSDLVLLDTGATFSSFANGDLLCNRQSQKKLIKMMMNTGSRVIGQAGTVPGYEEKVWYDDKSMANIFSFAELANLCHIT